MMYRSAAAVITLFTIYLQVTTATQLTQLNYTTSSQHDGDDVYPWFRPIRVHTHELNLNHHLIDSDVILIRDLVSHSVNKLSQIFSVFPVSSTLKLAIDIDKNCGAADHGIGHCTDSDEADSSPQYYDERCGLSSDFNTLPSVSALAFAQICKRDQNGRPIASYLNVCPDKISQVSQLKLRDIIFHEMIHAIGFSSPSFNFALESPCYFENGQYKCDYLDPSALHKESVRNSEVLTQTGGATVEYRFTLQRTRSAWQEHINCHDVDKEETMGPTLATYSVPGKMSTEPGSHWNWNAMMGSLMTSFVGEPYEQVLDRLTLSLLEDLGWYKVNYSFTEPLIWGSQSGCNFGEREFCSDVNSGQRTDRFICQRIGEAGCHYLHLHKAVCDYTIDSDSMCKYYKINHQSHQRQESACFTPVSTSTTQYSTDSTTHEDDDVTLLGINQEYCEDCRCFLSSLTNSPTDQLQSELLSSRQQPLCLRRRCINNELQININNNWISCPYNTNITVDGLEGVVTCPSSDVLCTERDLRLAEYLQHQATSQPSTVTTAAITQSSTTLDNVRDQTTTSGADQFCISSPLFFILYVYTLLVTSVVT